MNYPLLVTLTHCLDASATDRLTALNILAF